MIMAAAAFMVVVVVMMLMLFVIMAATAFMVVVMVMMLMVFVIMSAAAFMIMVVMMMLMVFVIMAATAFMVMIVVMMFSMFMYMSTLRAYLFLGHQFFLKRYRFLHNLKDFLSVQFLNRSGDDSSFRINSTKKFHRLLCFLLINDICTAHDDRTCIFNLIIKELTKVSHIHFALLCINYSCIAVQNDIHISLNTLYCLDNI